MKKVIVTNRGRLRKKYGDDLSSIDSALEKMIEADELRLVATEVINLDEFPGGAVTTWSDAKQNKDAIDTVAQSTFPDFILILGAADVVPHQDLINPLYIGADGNDTDEYAWSDLPYACTAPYGRDPGAFLAPTRNVGRIPDVIETNRDPSHLTHLIENASSWASRSRQDYAEPFSVSAEAWAESTGLSLKAIFGSSANLVTSPDSGPDWSNEELARMSYFINCHGVKNRPEFFGESKDGNILPVALESASLDGYLSTGAVAAIECSYAGEQHESSFANVFLRNGGHGCFSSTTMTYGAANENSQSDIICQRFLTNVLEGMSLGFAALNAQLDFVRRHRILAPVDLKTISQFYLAGDPSIQPVREMGAGLLAIIGTSTPATSSAVGARGAALEPTINATQPASGVGRRAAATPEHALATVLTFEASEEREGTGDKKFHLAFSKSREHADADRLRTFDIAVTHERDGEITNIGVVHRK